MEQLLEDYKRRLATVNKMIKECPTKEVQTNIRLSTKASCYRVFITELERALKD